MKFITKTIHAYLDYPVAFSLMELQDVGLQWLKIVGHDACTS